MSSINPKILKYIERQKQLEHQQQAQEVREKKKVVAMNKDRARIIGEFVSEYFPEVLRFKPCRTDEGNQVEFAPLIRFLFELSHDKEYITKVKGMINREQSIHILPLNPL